MDTTVYKLGCEFLETDADEETLQEVINKLTEEHGEDYDLDEVGDALNALGHFSRYVEINENIKNYIPEHKED
ncbi:hypothetical protein TSARBOMBA_258 [Bacillus phage TsarBomba]|uniref:Uncharacterized protein n=1 Tax=Bacillus phage TsarBomba TaxID=1690456 RepID=A0A0K2CZY2_9CAUD|nr:hypothetical protein TSARBOMBA_8 [Bacillus phage TsarBomba]YP_009207073.1 hypothetical protein TSARBOMBA_258 [Bacillus phage TsarBomba]ALA13097.1 hypothetical protein TSARBOMBA_258 [Bacillus phage TsarBomba]ALA13124.1 hypothetical protein TSARBOMBA_8 [Bacillus phage TsarBomba]